MAVAWGRAYPGEQCYGHGYREGPADPPGQGPAVPESGLLHNELTAREGCVPSHPPKPRPLVRSNAKLSRATALHLMSAKHETMARQPLTVNHRILLDRLRNCFFHRSWGVRPVCLPIRNSITGPISTPSWNAQT